MKINISSILLLVIANILHLTSSAQNTSKQFFIESSNISWSYHNICDTRESTNTDGERNYDATYHFQVNGPAIMVINNAGSELTNTRVEEHRIFPTWWQSHEDSSTISATQDLWSTIPLRLRADIEADIATILPEQAFLCKKVVSPCSYRIINECGDLGNGIYNGKIKTNIYVYYLDDPAMNAIDFGSMNTPFSAARESDSTQVYYTFTLTKTMLVSVQNNAGAVSKLTLLNSNGGELDKSDNYPQTENSSSQIVSRRLSPGTYYLLSRRTSGSATIKTSLSGEFPPEMAKEGDHPENPVDFGSVTVFRHITVSYDTREFHDYHSGYYSSGRKDVYLKFTFPQDVEFSLSPDDAKVGGAYVSLLDSNLKQQRLITTNNYPNTSLYESRLAAGTYYIVLEGAGTDGELGAEIRILPLNNLTDNLWAPSSNMNYVATLAPTYETSSLDYVSPRLSKTTIKYYDYLGRPSQTNQYAESPDGLDLVSQQDYNVYGIVSKSYLPVDIGNTGGYINTNSVISRGTRLYNDSNPYQLAKFDNTPMMRVVERYGPGQEWQNNGKAIMSNYNLNSDTIAHFAVAGSRSAPKLIRQTAYAPKSLFVTTTTDEDGHPMHKFVDINGRNILTRVETGNELIDTYSVFDDYGNLCFVLPPMLQPNNVSDEELNKYAFMYRYDYRNRCTGKKVPGVEWVYFIYDYADNLIFTQDGESLARGEWTCMLYDKLKRPVISGVYKGTVDRQAINGQVVSATFDRSGKYGYSFNVLDTNILDVSTVTYYDTYDYKDVISEYTSSLDYVGDLNYGIWYNRYAYNTKGLVTGGVTAVLDEDIRICKATYYNADKRPIQVRISTPEGGVSVKKFRYDFTGNVVKSCAIEQPTATASADTLVRTNQYDKTGRLLRTESSLNGAVPAVVSYEYDNIGQLVTTTQGEGADAIRTEKKYNIRGWLTEQTNDLFSMRLKYIDTELTAPSYTGTIMEWNWRHKDQAVEQTYAFAYDALSRLTDTRHYEGNTLTGRNVERGMAYDRNGNILSMARYADGALSSAYRYVYQGNQLNLLEALSTPALTTAMSHQERAHTMPPLIPIDPDGPVKPIDPEPVWPIDPEFPIKPIDPVLPDPENNEESEVDHLPFISPDTLYSGSTFHYDYNGNMVYDALRSRNMRYNRLNLLKKVFDPSTSYAIYRYLSDGTKLSVLDDNGNGLVYQGSLVYRKQGDILTLESAAVAGGRIVASQTTSGSSYAPRYYVSDHLGSTRAVTDVTLANTVSYDYYPFGKQWSGPEIQITDNRDLFNGKEWQPIGGVNLLDYGARMYDPELGRWFVQDPLATLYYGTSSYVYCLNNPLRYIDPDGKRIWPVNETYEGHPRRHENNYGASRPGGRTHGGVDINLGAGNDDLGAPIYATHNGRVTSVTRYNEDRNGGGSRVRVTANDGTVSTFYMHLGSINPEVVLNAPIIEGQQIGTMGGTGSGKEMFFASHLHYEMFLNGNRIDPTNGPKSLIDPMIFITPEMNIVIPEVIIQGESNFQRPHINFPNKFIDAGNLKKMVDSN